MREMNIQKTDLMALIDLRDETEMNTQKTDLTGIDRSDR